MPFQTDRQLAEDAGTVFGEYLITFISEGGHQDANKVPQRRPRPVSHFDYAGPLTEIVLLGVLALRSPGRRLEWDSENQKVKNIAELNQFVHADYRKDWAL